jgi:hypothetical protein
MEGQIMPEEKHVTVDSLVAACDKQPYVRIMVDGKPVAQLSTAEARQVAMDILQQSARAEADAMIWKFFNKADFPDGAAAALMLEFRDFRLELDTEWVNRSAIDPDAKKGVQ